MQKKIRAGRALLYIILVFWAVFMIMPFAWMLLTSVKTQPEAMKVPIVWLPKNPQWKNYVDVLQKYRFASYYKNTAFVTVTTVIFQLMTCSMGAYAFARLDFPGKNAIFLVCMTVLMVPTQMIIIPRFIMTMRLGWLNSFAGIIIPNLPSIYGVFFLRQNFMTLPRELDEAAMIDGCSFFGIYWRILLPLLKNGLIAFGVRTTLWSWNEMLWPLIVTSKQSLYVLSITLANMQGQYAQKIPTQMAAGVLAMAPMLLVFLIGQKQMLEGIALSSIKA
ncbi:MAG: carbohydrate ABC transporter permease [Eubacteriales bacterium]|nr:carbohydrate ABC transporter permease [Eubacteriales bacterium]